MRSFEMALLMLTVSMAGLVSCIERQEAPRLPIQQGWVPEDRVDACLGDMLRAPMPVHYLMPVDEALEVLGPPHGESSDLRFLRNFSRTAGGRAYYWHASASTLYVVYDRKNRLVQTLVVVDDVTSTGVEILLTREEILSMHVRPGMGVGEVYRIMGKPDRIEETPTLSGGLIDRFWYDPAHRVGPSVYIEVDRATLKVVHVSTRDTAATGPPADGE